MGLWIKHFSDSTMEIGTDRDISKKKASWSKGRLSNIIAVTIQDKQKKIIINGLGDWWQSDDYIVVNNMPAVRQLRRIQKQINSTDKLVLLAIDGDTTTISICGILNLADSQKVYMLLDKHVGKWFTVEISDKIHCYISDKRI